MSPVRVEDNDLKFAINFMWEGAVVLLQMKTYILSPGIKWLFSK